MDISLHITEWQLTRPFRISGHEWVNSRCLVVQLQEGGHLGRGEAQGIFYLDETAESIFSQANEVVDEIRKGISRQELQNLLPAGGARNAEEWHLKGEGKGVRSGRSGGGMVEERDGIDNALFVFGNRDLEHAPFE